MLLKGGIKMVQIDSWLELLIASATIIIVICVLVSTLKTRKIKVKTAKGEAVLNDTDLPCVPYVEAHTDILKRLEALTKDILDILKVHGEEIRALYTVQKSVIVALDVLLGLAEGQEINGQIVKARGLIATAQAVFDNVTIGKIGTM
jgi:hypothetical protein